MRKTTHCDTYSKRMKTVDMKTAEETSGWLNDFLQLLGSGEFNNQEGIINAIYFVEKYIAQREEIESIIDEMIEKASCKFELNPICNGLIFRGYTQALDDLKSKIRI